MPPDLQPLLVRARSAADVHPPALDQAVLADFLRQGHFARHLRRMRNAYRERLAALEEAALRLCGSTLHVRRTLSGLHAVADLEGAGASAVAREARARGLEVAPVAEYFAAAEKAVNALVLGFAAVPPAALSCGMEDLAAAIEAARASPA